MVVDSLKQGASKTFAASASSVVVVKKVPADISAGFCYIVFFWTYNLIVC